MLKTNLAFSLRSCLYVVVLVPIMVCVLTAALVERPEPIVLAVVAEER